MDIPYGCVLGCMGYTDRSCVGVSLATSGAPGIGNRPKHGAYPCVTEATTTFTTETKDKPTNCTQLA